MMLLNVAPPSVETCHCRVGVGKPLAAALNDAVAPAQTVWSVAVVVIAGAWLTVNVKFCVGELPALFVAVKVIVYVPPVPEAGVPARVPVPFPLSTNVTLLGRAAPPRVIVGVGEPMVVTVNVPAVPAVNVVAFALVMLGIWPVVVLKTTSTQ